VEKKVEQVLIEARVVLPGVQALLGFQFVVVLTDSFERLPPLSHYVHLACLGLMALAMILLMTPAAYHRQVEPGSVSGFYVRLASRLVAIAMLPLAVALCPEVYLLGGVIPGDPTTSFVAAGILLLIFAGLWYLFPWWVAARKKTGGR